MIQIHRELQELKHRADKKADLSQIIEQADQVLKSFDRVLQQFKGYDAIVNLQKLSFEVEKLRQHSNQIRLINGPKPLNHPIYLNNSHKVEEIIQQLHFIAKQLNIELEEIK